MAAAFCRRLGPPVAALPFVSRRLRCLLYACAVLLILVLPSTAAAERRSSDEALRYRLSIPEPTTRYVEIELALTEARSRATELAIPAWTPGSYLIRDFGRHVYEVEALALDGDERFPVERVDKQRWRVGNEGRGFRLRYRVFADELSVRTSYVDDRFALLNGASLFMYLPGATARPVELELLPPADWPVHTALDRDPSRSGGQHFVAPNYDELVDSPLLLGEAEVERFTVAGVDFELVFVASSGSNADIARIAGDAERIVRAMARTLNGLPLTHYSFLLIADAAGGGGLEHHDSTAMILRPWIFADDSGYARAQRLIAHEFFHIWNVKRIRDGVLGPFDYGREAYTDLLWFHEGFTETMETRALLRAGLLSPRAYLEQLANSWNRYRRRPGRNHTAIAELSRDAWIKAYKPAANHFETNVSYYEKGDLIGVCLDLELRLRAQARNGQGSLAGLFRRLWATRDARDVAVVSFDDIVAAASAEAGEDMRWFFERYVLGTEELPLPELLRRAGFEVRGEPARAGEAEQVWSGMSGGAGHGTKLTAIAADSPAAKAGLMLGDEPIAVAGTRVRSVAEANARLADLGVGQRSELSLFRRERLITRELTTAASPHLRWSFAEPEAEVDDLELAELRELWLLRHL